MPQLLTHLLCPEPQDGDDDDGDGGDGDDSDYGDGDDNDYDGEGDDSDYIENSCTWHLGSLLCKKNVIIDNSTLDTVLAKIPLICRS